MPRTARSLTPPELDVALLNGNAGTEWANLGDWTRAVAYPDAARGLALRVGRAAALGPGHRVLDVGVGSGEQLLVWNEGFGVSSIDAVERSPAGVERARARITAAGLPAHVREGDAARLEVGVAAHDRVLAVDCAYHFDPRPAFLRAAFRALAPGGRLALTDLVLRPRTARPDRRPARRLARLVGIPPENLVTVGAYAAALRNAGFTDVRFEDLSDCVLGGFSKWARREWAGLARRAPGGGWPAVAVTGWLAGMVHRRGWLSYVLVTARRAGP